MKKVQNSNSFNRSVSAFPFVSLNEEFSQSLQLLCRLSSMPSGPILLSGPSGTGKSVLARQLAFERAAGLRQKFDEKAEQETSFAIVPRRFSSTETESSASSSHFTDFSSFEFGFARFFIEILCTSMRGPSFPVLCWKTSSAGGLGKAVNEEISSGTSSSSTVGECSCFEMQMSDWKGLAKLAAGGTIFLNGVEHLPLESQELLLRFMETYGELSFSFPKRSATGFSSVSERWSTSNAGSSIHFTASASDSLPNLAREGRFRSDLCALLSTWTFSIPPLTERLDDLPQIISRELDFWQKQTGRKVTFSNSALQKYLQFASSSEAVWSGNLRDLRASIHRMAVLASLKFSTPDFALDSVPVKVPAPSQAARLSRMAQTGPFASDSAEAGELDVSREADVSGGVSLSADFPAGTITPEIAAREIVRLQELWAGEPPIIREEAPSTRMQDTKFAELLLGPEKWSQVDRFARAQLADVLLVCRQTNSLSEAGRILFSSSRLEKTTSNDTDRLRKYLLKFGISWSDIQNFSLESPLSDVSLSETRTA